MGVSKNSKKGSKEIKPMMMPKKEKPKKTVILIELTNAIKEEIKDDLSVFRNKNIISVIRKYGKDYLLVENN